MDPRAYAAAPLAHRDRRDRVTPEIASRRAWHHVHGVLIRAQRPDRRRRFGEELDERTALARAA